MPRCDCGRTAQRGKPLCWPCEHQGEWNKAQRRGGVNSAEKARQAKAAPVFTGTSAAEVHALLVQTTDGCARGAIPTSRARAIGFLAEKLLRAIETRDLERQLADLEAEVAQLRAGAMRPTLLGGGR